MSANKGDRELKFQLWGWILFIICAVLFIASSIRNHDPLSLAASFAFLLACVVFITPLVTKKPQRLKNSSRGRVDSKCGDDETNS